MHQTAEKIGMKEEFFDENSTSTSGPQPLPQRPKTSTTSREPPAKPVKPQSSSDCDESGDDDNDVPFSRPKIQPHPEVRKRSGVFQSNRMSKTLIRILYRMT